MLQSFPHCDFCLGPRRRSKSAFSSERFGTFSACRSAGYASIKGISKREILKQLEYVLVQILARRGCLRHSSPQAKDCSTRGSLASKVLQTLLVPLCCTHLSVVTPPLGARGAWTLCTFTDEAHMLVDSSSTVLGNSVCLAAGFPNLKPTEELIIKCMKGKSTASTLLSHQQTRCSYLLLVWDSRPSGLERLARVPESSRSFRAEWPNACRYKNLLQQINQT